jgi:hypothetical protein
VIRRSILDPFGFGLINDFKAENIFPKSLICDYYLLGFSADGTTGISLIKGLIYSFMKGLSIPLIVFPF